MLKRSSVHRRFHEKRSALGLSVLAPLQGALAPGVYPEVSQSLDTPATICHPVRGEGQLTIRSPGHLTEWPRSLSCADLWQEAKPRLQVKE
jgi:hypothetical protein